MIPRKTSRDTGHGGGGFEGFSVETPFFCKSCGKTCPPSQVLANVDVCKRCRVGNVSKSKGKKQ